MKTRTTEELLKELETLIINNTIAKNCYQQESKFERIRGINLLKKEILSRLK